MSMPLDPAPTTPPLEEFFAVAREREMLRMRKDVDLPKPWTEDPILRDNYFCNVFREDDRTTRWFREHIREPLNGCNRVVIATIVFRWFNYIPTGELIRPLLLDRSLDGKEFVAQLERTLRPLQQRGEKLFTGAFIVKSPNGVDKLTGILRCIDAAISTPVNRDANSSLEAMHRNLLDIPFLGPFMAYQIVCDLRYTHWLEMAPDINSWTAPGPGSARGMAWLFGGQPYSYTSPSGQSALIQQMRFVLSKSRDEALWPAHRNGWRPWELSTVQHWACEYDKYKRASTGERMKRRYPC